MKVASIAFFNQLGKTTVRRKNSMQHLGCMIPNRFGIIQVHPQYITHQIKERISTYKG